MDVILLFFVVVLYFVIYYVHVLNVYALCSWSCLCICVVRGSLYVCVREYHTYIQFYLEQFIWIILTLIIHTPIETICLSLMIHTPRIIILF